MLPTRSSRSQDPAVQCSHGRGTPLDPPELEAKALADGGLACMEAGEVADGMLIDGRHWWKVTVAGTPTFNFAFVNGNGAWDGTTRWYSANSSHVYVLPNSSNVAITRP